MINFKFHYCNRYGKNLCSLMHALNERNGFKASEYYIKFCRRFINRVYFISSAISKYLL